MRVRRKTIRQKKGNKTQAFRLSIKLLEKFCPPHLYKVAGEGSIFVHVSVAYFCTHVSHLMSKDFFLRLSVEMPFYSSSKPPQPIRLSIGRTPALYGTHIIRKSEFVILQSKLDNVTTILEDDDTPAILRSTATTSTGLKVSPNGKRVSPPHNVAGLTPPNRKGCRKLILKSIPSFPSLSNDAEQ